MAKIDDSNNCCGKTVTRTCIEETKYGNAACPSDLPKYITYKGMRYIIKFAEPIEWESTRAYEHLMVVKHNAFSYVSKKAVPVGVDIDNEEFWLLWADPNAQMGELRQIVAQYVDAVEDVKNSFDEFKTDINSDFDEFKTDINSDFDEFKTDINSDFDEFKTDINSDFDQFKTDIVDEFGPDLSYEEFVLDNSFGYMIKFSREKFMPKVAFNSGDPTTPATLREYAAKFKPYYCMNINNYNRFVYDYVNYQTDTYAPPSRSGYLGIMDDEWTEIDYIRANGQLTYGDIQRIKNYKYVIGSWQALIINGFKQEIDEYTTFHQFNPYPVFCWDDEYITIYFFFGRMHNKAGILFSEIQDMLYARGIVNAMPFDGGDSMRAFFGATAPIPLCCRYNTNLEDRTAYINVTIERKNNA